MNEQAPTVAQVFDMIAGIYDQTGVEFFGPVGRELVRQLDVRSGERCLDVGCGRGAVMLPMAAAAGSEGSVHGVDVSPGMVDQARTLAAANGLSSVSTEVVDASDLSALASDYDVVASSLVIFFLPDPASALRTWVERLVPGGRIGLVTFGEEDDASKALIDLLKPYAPPGLRDPKTVAEESPFTSDAAMENLLAGAGAREITTTLVPTTVEFADVEAWQRFSLSTGQRAMWMRVPEDDKPGVVARAAEILEPTRTAGGPCRLVWQMRYTLGLR